MRKSKSVAIGVLIFALIFTTGYVAQRWVNRWLAARPHWQISLHQSPDGAVLDVYKSNESSPTYHVQLKDQKIARNIDRVSRSELPPDGGKSVSHDETVKPGAWTVDLHGTEIQIMERALILFGEEQEKFFTTKSWWHWAAPPVLGLRSS